VRWESSASDIINRLVIRQGNNILQDTQDYNKAVCLLSDIQGSPSNNGVIYGRSDVGKRDGGVVCGAVTTEEIKEWAIPLAGLLSGSTLKALPLHALSNAPITIEITFDKYVSATLGSATNLTKFKVTDVYFTASQITFSPEVANVLQNQVGGKYLINTTSIQTFRNNVPAASTASTLIPVKVSYLKALMVMYFSAPDTVISTRVNPFDMSNSSYYSWMIGGFQIPSAPV